MAYIKSFRPFLDQSEFKAWYAGRYLASDAKTCSRRRWTVATTRDAVKEENTNAALRLNISVAGKVSTSRRCWLPHTFFFVPFVTRKTTFSCCLDV